MTGSNCSNSVATVKFTFVQTYSHMMEISVTRGEASLLFVLTAVNVCGVTKRQAGKL